VLNAVNPCSATANVADSKRFLSLSVVLIKESRGAAARSARFWATRCSSSDRASNAAPVFLPKSGVGARQL
jgi:hypothetical protein